MICNEVSLVPHSPGYQCQSTQTDAANQSRLSEELRKLTQIRLKLEQEQGREKYFKPIKQDKSKILCSRQELEYYKEGKQSRHFLIRPGHSDRSVETT